MLGDMDTLHETVVVLVSTNFLVNCKTVCNVLQTLQNVSFNILFNSINSHFNCKFDSCASNLRNAIDFAKLANQLVH